MEKVPLLEGEEIVSSVMCEPTPLFLTKKGWLAVMSAGSSGCWHQGVLAVMSVDIERWH